MLKYLKYNFLNSFRSETFLYSLPKKEYTHLEASIDYIKEGGYYLIRYEKGVIRAWGAIKIKQ